MAMGFLSELAAKLTDINPLNSELNFIGCLRAQKEASGCELPQPASAGNRETSISPALFRGEEIGAVAAGLFEGLLAAPFGDVGVITADEDFGDGPAAEISGAGVVREVEERAVGGQGAMQLGRL